MSDTIAILNGRIRTMDADRPVAEAILIRGNRIAAVGDSGEIAALAGADALTIDAAGGTVLPGFNDAHVHIFSGSVGLSQLALDTVRGFQALSESIRAHAARHPGQGLLVAKGCVYTVISETERLSRHHIDRILPDRPLMLMAFDHHTAWANTAALTAAGILQGRDVGLGNQIVMGDDGLATGELREANAFAPVTALAENGGRDMLGVSTGGDPATTVSDAERQADIAAIRRGLAYCAELGITSIQNMDGNLYQLELLDAIERDGGLPVRVRMPFHMKNFMPLSDLETKAARWMQTYATDRLRCDMVKMFMDGVTESETALFVEDYAHRSGWKGEALFAQAHFNDICATADGLGLQIAVHAVGDGAVRGVLDGFQHAGERTGKTDRRHRVEHIEVVHPDDVPRFAELGAVASVQPIHAPSGAELTEEPSPRYVGAARWPHAFAWRDLAEAGARIVFSTDWPVVPLNPMISIEAAMTREPFAADVPDQRLPLDHVLQAYTAEGAWLEYMEDRKGVLKPGFLADLVVLDGDIHAVAPAEISRLRPIATICDGTVTYRRTA